MILYIIKTFFLLIGFASSYRLFLQRDTRFHFNRFYLLMSVCLSLMLPLIAPFDFFFGNSQAYSDDTHLPFAKESWEIIEKSSLPMVESLGFDKSFNLWIVIYLVGTVLLAWRFIFNLLVLLKIIRSAQRIQKEDYVLVLSDRIVSPFSFWKFIVINKEEYLVGSIKTEIIDHEYAHVKYLHSMDRIFMEVVILIFWFNPLLWYYNFLIRTNHEFCADAYALRHSSGRERYLKILLHYLNLSTVSRLANAFNYSHFKQRITMMKQLKTSRVKFCLKLCMALVVIMTFIWGINSKPANAFIPDSTADFVVIIDAGHGGKDDGGISHSGLLEKDITLALSKAIAQEGNRSDIRFIFTRDGDRGISLHDRSKRTNEAKANLMISLHMNWSENVENPPTEIFYSTQNNIDDLSYHYATLLTKRLTKRWSPTVRSRNVVVLRESTCPAVLINLGFAHEEDIEFISSKNGQKEFAQEIVSFVESLQRK